LKEIVFCEGTPDSYSSDFDPSIFNLHAHRMLQSDTGWVSFHAVDNTDRKILASVHFCLRSSDAWSPLRAPFGSVEFSDALATETLFEFLKFAESQLAQRGVRRMVIKNSPENYSGRLPVVTTMLINLGYHVLDSEVAAGIPVTRAPLENSLHRSERRRLERCKSEGLTFRQLPSRALDDIYGFIHSCRSEKNFNLSMTLDDMQRTIDQFPERYLLFGLYDGRQLAAASICIRVTKNILYDFYHDHSSSYDQYSPVVMLVNEIYHYCQREDVRLLDLGTSAENGRPNFGLLHFKLLIGGRASNKFTFEKHLR